MLPPYKVGCFFGIFKRKGEEKLKKKKIADNAVGYFL